MTDTATNSRTSRRAARTKFFVMIGAAAVLSLAGWYWDLPRQLRVLLDWVDGLGTAAPVAFILIYILATVLFVPGSIPTLGAGAIFGVLWGTAFVSVGSTLGATLAFLIGRYFMRDWVSQKIAGSERFTAVDEAVGREGGKIVFLLRLSPVFPYNLSNYAFSLTKVSVGSYMLASWIGMLPGTVMYVFLGSLIESLAVIGAEERARTTGEWVLYGVGLLATIAVTVFVTRLARRAIRQRIG